MADTDQASITTITAQAATLLEPERVLRAGRWFWSFGGRLVPEIAGGDGSEGEGTSAGGGQGDGGSAPGTSSAGTGNADGQEPKTFDADYVKQLRTESAGHRSKVRELEGKLESAKSETVATVLKALGLEPDPQKNFENQLAEAKQAATQAEQRANGRLIQAEARVQAAALGVRPERVAHALKLADLSDVQVGDDGEPDAKAVKAALEKVLADLPELKGSGPSTSATNPARTGQTNQNGGLAGAIAAHYRSS